MTAVTEEVVLLDDAGRAIGSAPKAAIHHTGTPLHLAFSCYVFDPTGRLLVTRRAWDKQTFPGVVTNSVCGHPAPGEELLGAVRRRARHELGIELDDVRLVLPAFRYEATMPDGVRENELCPVFVAVTDCEPTRNPDEVAEVEWEPWARFREQVTSGAREVSLWCALQVAELRKREEADGRFAVASYDDLPRAAR